MRIGLAIDTFNIGGAETMVIEIAKLLRKSGHEVILLHFGNEYISRFADEYDFEEVTVPNHGLYKKIYYLPLFAFRTARFLEQLNLDCLHSHLFGTIFAFSMAARLSNLPHVGTLHDVHMVQDAPYRLRMLNLAIRLGTSLIAVSAQMRDFYVQTGSISERKLQYVPNFCRANPFIQSRQAYRRLLGVADHEVVAVAVGRLVRLKRFDRIVDAVSLIPSNVGLRVFIVGSGPETCLLNDRIEHLRLNNRVKLLGERNDVEQLLAGSDVFVLPSETEGMSRSVLEGLAAGLPIIASNVGGNSSLVQQGINGFLLDDCTPEAIAASLLRLAGSDSLRRQMSLASSELVARKYGAEAFLTAHLAVYGHAIQQGRPRQVRE